MSIANSESFVSTNSADNQDSQDRKNFLSGGVEYESTRKTKPRNRTQTKHDLEVLSLVLNGVEYPAHCHQYAHALYILSDEADEHGVLMITDRRLADAVSCGLRQSQHKALNSMVRRLRGERHDVNQWQARRDEEGLQNPVMIDFVRDYHEGEKKNYSVYRSLPFVDLVREVNESCGPNTPKKRLKQTVRQVLFDYLNDQKSRKWKKPKERKHSPESEINRAWALIEKACGEVAMSGGTEAAIGLINRTLAPLGNAENSDKKPSEIFAILRNAFSDKGFIGSNLTFSGCDGSRHTLEGDFDTLETHEIEQDFVTAWEDAKPQEEGPCHVLPSIQDVTTLPDTPSENIQTENAVTKPSTAHLLSIADFVASNPAYRNADKSGEWGKLPMTAKQRDWLAARGVYESLTIAEATARIGEMYGGPNPDWYSLEELQQYDPRGGRGTREMRFCCPACAKSIHADHRDLSASKTTGEYFCHVCKTAGILREHCEAAPVSAPRIFLAPSPAKTEPTDDRWRKWYADAKPVANTPGAKYLTGRAIPSDVATLAGVKFGTWWKASDEGDKPERFNAVIFPIRNEAGELVAAQARAITGDVKRTKGAKSEGIFLASPDVLKSPRIAITEAPIDGLALAAGGIPSIALCGTSWPDWLVDALAGREVFIATDADEAGDKAADELHKKLIGLAAPVNRFRPIGAKDWAEIAQRYGLISIEAQFDYLTGEAGNDETHDFPFEVAA